MSKMVSGESYTLSQIFSGENDKVVILTCNAIIVGVIRTTILLNHS